METHPAGYVQRGLCYRLMTDKISSKVAPVLSEARGSASRITAGLHGAAFKDLAVLVDLAEFPLGVGFIPAMDREVLDHEALSRADSKAVFLRRR